MAESREIHSRADVRACVLVLTSGVRCTQAQSLHVDYQHDLHKRYILWARAPVFYAMNSEGG